MKNSTTGKLNFRFRNENKGKVPYEGTAYLTNYKDKNYQVSWNLWTTFCKISFETGQDREDDINFSFAFPPAAFWISLSHPVLRRLSSKIKGEKAVQVNVHDWTIFWKFWEEPHSWSSRTPKWKDGSFNILNFLLGEEKFKSEIIKDKVSVEIPMPERSYKGFITLTKDSWKRPRWFVKTIPRATIEMDEDSIPVPGKGENSYDCDDDSIYSSSFPAKTIPEAIGKMVEYVLKTRYRYGGANWLP